LMLVLVLVKQLFEQLQLLPEVNSCQRALQPAAAAAPRRECLAQDASLAA
jgi:hypothetical protein